MKAEVKIKLGICPFCGEELIADEVSLMHLECTGCWHFSHYCCDDEDDMHRVSISVRGRTKKEVIKLCKQLNRKDV